MFFSSKKVKKQYGRSEFRGKDPEVTFEIGKTQVGMDIQVISLPQIASNYVIMHMLIAIALYKSKVL